MKRCTICDAKGLSRIEAALASGRRSVLSVSKEFGVSYDALRRHR
jgi:hypothetical protein